MKIKLQIISDKDDHNNEYHVLIGHGLDEKNRPFLVNKTFGFLDDAQEEQTRLEANHNQNPAPNSGTTLTS